MKKIIEKCLIIIILLALNFLFGCKKEGVPAITTTPLTDITGTSAVSGGTIVDDGGIAVISRGVCWSTKSNPTVEYVTKTIDGTGTGTFLSSIAGLTANTKYYVKAYATNTIGTGYGNEITFTTNNTFIDRYSLEIDNNYLIYKVSLSSYDSLRNFIIEYVYSPGRIKKTLTYSGEPGERETEYHINRSGLADTSLYWIYYNGNRLSSSASLYFYDSITT
jgi:hypothetical protein